MKLLYIILIVCLLFVMSMINGKSIYNPGQIIDCKVGNYTFSIEKRHCRTTFEYRVYSLFNRP
jgi:hypothetical protein